MPARRGVTLQISLAPTDLPTARHTLPHQLRTWSSQVDEVLLVLDLHRSRGRFADAWEERLPGMRTLIAEMCARYRHARAVDVDYSAAVAARLAERYFGGFDVPAKDYNGAPFYTYFYALDVARYPLVLHLDVDMMFGGGSTTWIAEAVHLLADRPDILTVSPLPGPPTPDGSLRSQQLERVMYAPVAYRKQELSTRQFMINRDRFIESVAPLHLRRPPVRQLAQAVLDGNPPYLAAELIVSHAMVARGFWRVEFLGQAPGMWSVHPPYRSSLFYEMLPEIIARVEAGAVSEGQRGCHDLNDSMIDWSGAHRSRWQRIATHARLAAEHPLERIRG